MRAKRAKNCHFMLDLLKKLSKTQVHGSSLGDKQNIISDQLVGETFDIVSPCPPGIDAHAR